VSEFITYLCTLIGGGFTFAGCLLFSTQVLGGREQAEAEILAVEIESLQTSDDDGRPQTTYRAKYEVRYQADGRAFQLTVHGNVASHSPDEARRKSLVNPPGSRRPVYYLPTKPDDFVLDPLGRRLGASLLTLSIGLSVLACSALLWCHLQPLDW
jgi:hypothetical protein